MPSYQAYTIRGLAANGYIRVRAITAMFWCAGESSEVPIKHIETSSLDRFQPGLGTTLELLQIQAIKPVPLDSCQHENRTNLSETRQRAGETLLTISVNAQTHLYVLVSIGHPLYIGVLEQSRAKFSVSLGKYALGLKRALLASKPDL